MTNSAVQTTLDISVSELSGGVLSPALLQIGKDLLSGYSGGYFLFQSGENQYILILSDDFELVSFLNQGYSITFSECDWFLIDAIVPRSRSDAGLHGSFSGSTVESDAVVSSFSGSSSQTLTYYVDGDPSYQVRFYHDNDGATLYNLHSYLAYSSIEHMPHLIEGGTYYAFVQTVVLCVVCLFVLLDRIFKHVS